MYLCLFVNAVCVGSMTYYFCNIVLNDVTVITLTTMAGTIPAIIANFANPMMVHKWGKRKVMIAGSFIMMIGSIIIGAAGANIPIVLLGIIVKGFGQGPIMSGVFAMTADIVDYGEWKTGIRSEGLINSCTSFGMKVGIGLGSAVGVWILE